MSHLKSYDKLNMKRIAIFIFAVLLFASDAFSQNTIKFLGIPIDGTKKEMIDALEAKGYTYNSVHDVLSGEFNGQDVYVFVQTVNNRVWRIAIFDQSFTNETNVKIRFNNLLNQFANNSKYIRLSGEKLGDKEDISYEIIVHKKRYEASFGFRDENVNGQVWYMIGEDSGSYSIAMFYENLDNAANGDDL